MTVKRIVPNLSMSEPEKSKAFFQDVLSLDLAMDMGWIATFQSDLLSKQQLSLATEGGSDTPLPHLSIEVDNFEEVYQKAVNGNYEVTYGPVDEPWGIRRFFVVGPSGYLLNISKHI